MRATQTMWQALMRMKRTGTTIDTCHVDGNYIGYTGKPDAYWLWVKGEISWDWVPLDPPYPQRVALPDGV